MPSFDLTVEPSGFRTLYGTSLGVDDLAFDLVVPPAEVFPTTLPLTVPSGSLVPATGAGALEVPGSQDVYEVQVSADARLVFDPSGCVDGMTFTLVEVDGGARGLLPTDACQRTITPRLDGGTYRLEVTAPVAGEYAFGLREAAAPQVFDLTLGTSVEDGSPGAGAGAIEAAGALDRYLFSVPSGSLQLQYDRLSGDNPYVLTDRTTGDVIHRQWQDNRFTLPAGDYQLEFAGDVGTYSFRLFEVPAPQLFDYYIGSTVADGVPGPGAGNIETIASEDRYHFTIPAGGMTVQYQKLAGNRTYTLVERETDNFVARGWTNQQHALPAGDYALVFTGKGTYSFRIFEVPPPQDFDIAIGSIVANGSPAAGAGNMETIASVDRYDFTIPAGGMAVQYDHRAGDRTYTLIDRATGTVIGRGFGDKQYDLPAGDYQLRYANQMGVYSFALFQVPGPEVFAYAIGDVVSDGVPAAGAGNMETIASIDRYNFTVPAGGLALQYDHLGGSKTYTLTDRVTGTVVEQAWNDHQLTLPAGDYQLEFAGGGTYSFKLFVVPAPQVFSYVIGDTVSNGVPAAGAGNMETIASIDRCNFTVPAGGLALQYDHLGGSKTYTLTDRVTGTVVEQASNDHQLTLPAGDYQLEFAGGGTYSFKLFVV